jgi:hypothetical protein
MDSINDIEEGLSKSIKLKYKKNRSHPIWIKLMIEK